MEFFRGLFRSDFGATNLELQQEITRRELVEAELRRVQSELEERIHERTAALEQANRALQREVAERERAEEQFRRRRRLLAQWHAGDRREGRDAARNAAVERIFG